MGCYYCVMQYIESDKTAMRIKTLRKAIPKLTQQEAANRARMSQPYWSQLESGDVELSVEYAEKIAPVLNTTAQYLLFGTDTDRNEKSPDPEMDEAIRKIKNAHQRNPKSLSALTEVILIFRELHPEHRDRLAAALSQLFASMRAEPLTESTPHR